MSATEYIVLAGMIIVGLLFFVMAQTFIFTGGKEAREYGYRAEGEEIVSLIERITNEPAEYVSYYQYINLCNISIGNGILTYYRDGTKYSFQVPKEVNDTDLIEIASICIIKSGGKVNLFEECPTCNFDSICTPDECKENCPDCTPADCCGIEGCNPGVGENCYNCPVDCSCDVTEVCCPSSPDADEKGCSHTMGLPEGEECWCSGQCESGLECNPTTPEFKDYAKACCEPGKSWNGSVCVVVECKYPCVPGCKLPEEWDWRSVDRVNYLNPVRDQASCGSCWAFSAVGAMEGTYNVEQNCPACNEDLSEQNLVSSCCPAGSCTGGWPHLALNYIKSSGIVDESCFPYTSSPCVDALRRCLPQCSCGGGVCSNPCSCSRCAGWSTRLWYIENYKPVSNNINDIKRALICHGPLSVASMNWGHAIVLVGYDDNTERWIIRNSWGPGWGDGGYGYIPYTGHPYSDLRNYVYYVEGVTS